MTPVLNMGLGLAISELEKDAEADILLEGDPGRTCVRGDLEEWGAGGGGGGGGDEGESLLALVSRCS